MIDDEWRYFAPSGAITPDGPSQWHILDWDQRRIISVTMDEQQESEDAAVGHLKKHIDALGPDIYAIRVSQDGELISVSTKPEDDHASCVYYLPLQDVQCPSHVKTVLCSDLLELDRLGPDIDLVSYLPSEDAAEPKRKKSCLQVLLPPAVRTQVLARDECVDASACAPEYCPV